MGVFEVTHQREIDKVHRKGLPPRSSPILPSRGDNSAVQQRSLEPVQVLRAAELCLTGVTPSPQDAIYREDRRRVELRRCLHKKCNYNLIKGRRLFLQVKRANATHVKHDSRKPRNIIPRENSYLYGRKRTYTLSYRYSLLSRSIGKHM